MTKTVGKLFPGLLVAFLNNGFAAIKQQSFYCYCLAPQELCSLLRLPYTKRRFIIQLLLSLLRNLIDCELSIQPLQLKGKVFVFCSPFKVLVFEWTSQPLFHQCRQNECNVTVIFVWVFESASFTSVMEM